MPREGPEATARSCAMDSRANDCPKPTHPRRIGLRRGLQSAGDLGRHQRGDVERAGAAGVRALTIPHKDFASREAFDRALVSALREAEVNWVVLAGFMRVLSPEFLDAYRGRIINIHPSLLPAFPGVDAAKQALDYGVKLTGCTVHFVDHGVDSGRIIAQRAVPVEPFDDLSSLAARIHGVEHELFVNVLREIAAGRVVPFEG